MPNRPRSELSTARQRTHVARLAYGAIVTLLFALLVIPARLVVAPLGGAGSPAQLIGLCLFTWWGLARVATWGNREPINPVARGALLFLGSVCISFAIANSRWMTALESSAAMRGVLSAIGLAGMTLFVAEKVADLDDLTRILRMLTTIVSWLGVFGAVQFATRERFIEYIQIPGLSPNSDVSALEARGPFLRPTATLTHPIEYGSVLTMALPLALHFAMHGEHRNRWRQWWPTASIGLAIAFALTRSAIVAGLVALTVVLVTWPARQRGRAALTLVLGTAFLNVTVPGLVGTIRGMFSTVSGDPSAQSRTDSYGAAFEFINRSPIFGRGFRTFMPEYRILDNQYLLSLIETGIVGFATFFIGILGVSIYCTTWVRRHVRNEEQRSLANALCAAVLSAATSFALYDAFSFIAAAGGLFLLCGCCGALRRLALRAPAPAPDSSAATTL